jgi:predicted nucleotide-binding protein
MKIWTRPTNVFLHFFDTHFLTVKAQAVPISRLKAECRLATRFSILSAERTLIPAASYFETDVCRTILGELEPLYDTGLLFLVGGGEDILEFIEDKRGQYSRKSEAHRRYFSRPPRRLPPFLSRTGSATQDIIHRWSTCLEIPGRIAAIFHKTGVQPPRNFEREWNRVPERLGRRAFIVDHVEPLVLPRLDHRTVRNRLHAIVNPAYFESFTKEYQAGVVQDLLYLEANYPVPSSGTNLPYRRLIEECRKQGLLPRIDNAEAMDLIGLRYETTWLETVAAAGVQPDRLEVVRQYVATGGVMEGLRSFIVHGHDETEKLALKNYLQNTLKWPEPVILAEKPSGGKTIIEKFEEHSKNIDVVFVLLTPDDVGGAAGAPSASRARQNVIFELGYFAGKFGRTSGRAILLRKGDLDLPTDLAGIVYINISKGIEAAGEEIRREVARLTRIN